MSDDIIVSSAPTYYPVSESQNPFGLEGEVEAYGPMVAVADFNNDGNPDLAVENNYTAVMVRLGDGSGGFGAENRYDLGGAVRPNAILARDLDADGNLDLVTANQSSLSVLRGNGNGTFGAAASYAIQGCWGQPCYGSVTAVDVNGDGKLDLATANSWGISVSVLLNQGGTFAVQRYPFAGSEFQMLFVGAALVDGDGMTDLLVGHQTSIFVMSGKANGTFTTTDTIALGEAARFVLAGNFDRDVGGLTDLLVSSDAGRVVLLHGEPDAPPSPG